MRFLITGASGFIGYQLSLQLAGIDRSYPDNTPMDEHYPCFPRTAYGQTKRKGEHILEELAA